MKRHGVALVILLLAGCARQSLTLLPEADLPRDVYGPPQAAPMPEPFPANGVIYFVSGRQLEPITVRLQPVLDTLEEALLVALFQGAALSQEPDNRKLATEIPEGTRLNGVDIAGGIATIDVSGDFEHAAPPRSQALRIAQVVYTLTEKDTGIGGVRFEIDGVPQEAIGGAQLGAIFGPVTRDDYEVFAPQARKPSKRGG
jgi:hypothetical protein